MRCSGAARVVKTDLNAGYQHAHDGLRGLRIISALYTRWGFTALVLYRRLAVLKWRGIVRLLSGVMLQYIPSFVPMIPLKCNAMDNNVRAFWVNGGELEWLVYRFASVACHSIELNGW